LVPLSVKKMQEVLYRDMRVRRWPWIITNTKALGAEADLVGVTAGRFVTEFEIKRYHADFKADFKKKQKHRHLQEGKLPINQFYFVCPAGLIQPEEVPSMYGLIWIEKSEPMNSTLKSVRSKKEVYKIITKRAAKKLHTKKLSDYYLVKLLTSMTFRYWTLILNESE
jgi:hypothetical protein